MNEKLETTNYIENAIKFKNLQDRQKINQTGDKLLCFGPDKLPNVTSVTQSDSSMGRTYLSLSRSPFAKIPQREEIPNVMSPGRVTKIDSSMGSTYQSVSRSPSSQILQREEISNVMSPGRVDSSMISRTYLFTQHPLKFPNKKESNLPSTPHYWKAT